MTDAPGQNAIALVGAGARGLCPECAAPTLFAGPVHFAEHCRTCGADFSEYDMPGGTAILLAIPAGLIVLALAMLVENMIRPPVFVHLLWLPVSFGAVIGVLRVAKGVLLNRDWRNRARRGPSAG